MGLRSTVASDPIVIGSRRMLATEGISIPATLVDDAGDGTRSSIFVARGATLLGRIDLRPVVRPEARRIVRALHARGLELHILSGDREAPTRALATELGIDAVRAEALPAEKARYVEALRAHGRSVCFVGDGINDAIALKAANVSVSLNGASAIALDTASVVLIDGSLERLDALFGLADDLERDLDRGMALSIAPGVLVAAGLLTGAMGVAGAVLTYNLSMGLTAGHALLPRLRHRATQVRTATPDDTASTERHHP